MSTPLGDEIDRLREQVTVLTRKAEMGKSMTGAALGEIGRLKGELAKTHWLKEQAEQQIADANAMIANLHRDLAEAEESRDGWVSEHDKAVEQLADERHDHDTTKRLLSEQVNKRWKLQQALEAVANTECTNGRHFCKYCNSYTDEPHRDYCVVAPVLGLSIEAPREVKE